MKSQTRIDCENAVVQYLPLLPKTGELLYVGIAGDPIPKGEYSIYFPNYNVTTLDGDINWRPDIVLDITVAYESLDKKYDLIIMTQVIEHIPNLSEVAFALYQLLNKDGYLIIDCPFNYPYHAEPPSFGDYWRITKDGFKVLFNELNWKEVSKYCTNNNTSFLFQKHTSSL